MCSFGHYHKLLACLTFFTPLEYRLAKTNKMDLMERFKQSVQYFVNGTQEGYFKGVPQQRGQCV